MTYPASCEAGFMVSGLDAPSLIKDAANAVGGGGGGKGDIATAGGRDASKIDDALALARSAAGI